MADEGSRERIFKDFETAFFERHKNPVRDFHQSFVVSVETALAAIAEPIEFYDMKASDAESYGTAFVLAGGRVYTLRAGVEKFEITYFGELPGGDYAEELKLDDGEIVEATLRYSHIRAPGGSIEYSLAPRDEGRFEPLRKQLRDWANAKR
jgi:hypothetical protein